MKRIIMLLAAVVFVGFFNSAKAEEYKVADISNTYVICGNAITVFIVEAGSSAQPIICISMKELSQVEKYFGVKDIREAKGMVFFDTGVAGSPVMERMVRELKEGRKLLNKISGLDGQSVGASRTVKGLDGLSVK